MWCRAFVAALLLAGAAAQTGVPLAPPPTPAPTLSPAVAPAGRRQLCERFHGFAGDAGSSFDVPFKGVLNTDKNEALMFVADPLSTAGPVRVNVSLPMVGREPQCFSSADGMVVLPSALANGKTLHVDVDPVAIKDSPFAFFTYVANAPTCAINFEAANPVAGPLPVVNQQPALGYFATSPTLRPMQFVLTLTASVRALATYSASADFVTGAVAFSSDAPATGTLDQGASLFVTVRPEAALAGRFSLSVQWADAPAVPGGPVPGGIPGGIVAATPAPAAATGSTVMGVLFNMVVFGALGYFLLRSAYNYRQGITTWPEYVPHHEAIRAAFATLSNLGGSLRSRLLGEPIGVHHGGSGIPAQSTRGGYNPVSGVDA